MIPIEKQLASFWSRIQYGALDECWPWLGSRSDGYGVLNFQGKAWKAHRLIWSLVNNPIPEGAFICHHCDNPPCCNPHHLFLGSPLANMRDAANKGRLKPPDNRGERHGLSKLLDSDIVQIRALAATGIPQKQIAADFKIDSSTVSVIIHRKRWQHIP